MGINETFIAEMQQEAAATRKLLERVPMDKADWTPHVKSMKLGNLANHVAELLSWTMVTLDQDELDFAKFEYKRNLKIAYDFKSQYFCFVIPAEAGILMFIISHIEN